MLLEVGALYYALVGAEASLAAIRRTEADVEIVVKLTAEHAAKGQGRQADADRARSEDLLFHQDELRAEEETAVASARLAQVLNVDPSTRLVSRSEPVQWIELVNLSQPVDKLVETALAHRPEMAARAAAIQASREALSSGTGQALPSHTISRLQRRRVWRRQQSGGIFFWQCGQPIRLRCGCPLDLAGPGTGQSGAYSAAVSAEIRQAEADQLLTINTIRDEVAEAVALASASQRKLAVVQRQLKRATGWFRARFAARARPGGPAHRSPEQREALGHGARRLCVGFD